MPADDDFASNLERELQLRDRDRLRDSIRNGRLDDVFGPAPKKKQPVPERRVTIKDIMERWK